MSTHNICFYGELTKIVLYLSSNTFCELAVCRAGYSFQGKLNASAIENTRYKNSV